MSCRILGLGTSLPAHRMSQDQSAALARRVICRTEQQARVVSALWQKAGIRDRFTALPHETALRWTPAATADGLASAEAVGPTTGERMQFYAEHAFPLAQRASERALTEAATEGRQVTHLITVSCTGFAAPGVDIELIGALELRPTTQRVHLGFMGCHAAINALGCARAITLADPGAVVLLCATELCSVHYCFGWDPQRMVANAIFGDGAAAAVLGAGQKPGGACWGVRATGSCLLPGSKEAMTWRIGDHGFEMSLAATVPDLIRTHLASWLTDWLGSQGHSLQSIGSWAIHPGGPRILHAAAEALHLNREQIAVSEAVLAQQGNMSSPTVLFIIDRLRQQAARLPCVALAFGPGLCAEAALLT